MIQVSTLKNGMRVVSDVMPHIETASFGVWVNVGARNESKALNGASHFLEHMAFKGTETRNANQIACEIESLGGYLNAYTSRENTAYYVRMLKSDIETGFDVLSDILLNSTFEAQEFDKERVVILQELYQTIDTPDDIIFDYFQEATFGNTSFGRPILGTEETIHSFTPEIIKGYMKQNYDMKKMVFSASGNVNHAQILELCEKYFGGNVEANPLDLEKITYQPKDFRKNKDLEQAHLLLGFEGFASGTSEYYASVILSTILGGGMSSRLFQDVREKRGLVYNIFASSSSFKETGLFQIYASSGPATVGEVLPVVCDVLLDSLGNITEAELKKSKNQLIASLMMSMESSSGRAESKAMQLINFDRIIPLNEMKTRIENVTLQNVSEVLKKMLSLNPAFTALGPIKKVQSYDDICGRLAQ